MKKLLLIDGSNLIFRAYYATEKLTIKNPENKSVNAIYGLMNMLNKIIQDEAPDHMFIALDRGGETFRHQMFSEYKGGRESAPEKLKEQFPIIHEYFDALGIKKGDSTQYEADDLIATYAKIGQEKGYFVKVISGDKDLLQLIDQNINVLTPKIGFAKECNYTPQVFEEKYEFPVSRFIEYKALVGDSSDNIIGIEKLGDKTAKKLIKGSSDIEEILTQAIDGKITGKVGENIKNNTELIRRNLKLVTLICDAQLEMPLEELEFSGINVETYGEFLKKQGFLKAYNALLKENGIQKKEEQISIENISEFSFDKHIKGTTYLYTQNLTDNYILSPNLGIGISNELGNFYLELEDVNEEFRQFLKSDHPKVFYNLKSLMVNTKTKSVGGVKTDIYLALSLINNENYKKTIDQNLVNYQVYNISPFEEIYKAKSNPIIPEKDIVIKDILTKTISLKKVYESVLEDVDNAELNNVLNDIELPLTQTLANMELTGVYVNIDKLEQLKVTYTKQLTEDEEQLKKYTDINFNSFNQLSELLFTTWELPKKGIKKTASGYSTDVDNLNKLLVLLNQDQEKYQNPINFINSLLDYRKTSKLLNTYVKNIEKFITKDNKLHPINHQLLAETGRLSVMDPSIQNMPIRSKLGQEIRSLFESKTGLIMAFDYSQIELRVIAHFSQDQAMVEAFNHGDDIHKKTAQKILETSNINEDQRSQAKAINFGIIYGMSSYGLAKQVGISNFEAEQFIQKYFIEYPGIKKYIDSQITSAKSSGVVRTLFERKRTIPNINSKNYKEKEAASRMAINTPIQGTAADIMKLALIKVSQALITQNLKSQIIMQIHDEIVLDVDPKEEETIVKLVKEQMESVVKLSVNLKVDYGSGSSWLDAK